MQNPNYSLQMHSSLIQRLSQEKELEVGIDFSFYVLWFFHIILKTHY